jgi:hypothetical protein
MRIALLIIVMLGAVAVAALGPGGAPAPDGLVPVVSAQVPPVPPGEPLPPQPSPLAVETDEARGTGWGASAVWIVIGMIALVLLAVATIMSVRGRGRTVLKE